MRTFSRSLDRFKARILGRVNQVDVIFRLYADTVLAYEYEATLPMEIIDKVTYCGRDHTVTISEFTGPVDKYTIALAFMPGQETLMPGTAPCFIRSGCTLSLKGDKETGFLSVS